VPELAMMPVLISHEFKAEASRALRDFVNTLDAMILGSTTHTVVRRATCPVLTARG
jgi:nucleotide-binding universal stress UspA family protein